MRYIVQDNEKLAQQSEILKSKIQQIGKWHIKHRHSDSAHIWSIMYNNLEEIANSTHRLIRQPIFEIIVYPWKNQFSIRTNKSYYTCYQGYITKTSDYKSVIFDLKEILLKYDLILVEKEESLKKNSNDERVFQSTREYEVKFVENN